MLRSIVGWVRTHGEQWQDTMRKMNGRLDFAMTLFRVRRWSNRFFKGNIKFAIPLAQQMQVWPAKAAFMASPHGLEPKFRQQTFS